MITNLLFSIGRTESFPVSQKVLTFSVFPVYKITMESDISLKEQAIRIINAHILKHSEEIGIRLANVRPER